MEAEELGYTEPELVEHSLVRTQVTADHQSNFQERQWEAVRDECASGGAMDERCSIVAASLGHGKLEVVSKKLSCGCILVPLDSEEKII